MVAARGTSQHRKPIGLVRPSGKADGVGGMVHIQPKVPARRMVQPVRFEHGCLPGAAGLVSSVDEGGRQVLSAPCPVCFLPKPVPETRDFASPLLPPPGGASDGGR